MGLALAKPALAQPRILSVTPVLSFNIGANQAMALGRDFVYEDRNGEFRRAPVLAVVGWDAIPLEGIRGHLRVFDVSVPESPELIWSSSTRRTA